MSKVKKENKYFEKSVLNAVTDNASNYKQYLNSTDSVVKMFSERIPCGGKYGCSQFLDNILPETEGTAVGYFTTKITELDGAPQEIEQKTKQLQNAYQYYLDNKNSLSQKDFRSIPKPLPISSEDNIVKVFDINKPKRDSLSPSINYADIDGLGNTPSPYGSVWWGNDSWSVESSDYSSPEIDFSSLPYSVTGVSGYFSPRISEQEINNLNNTPTVNDLSSTPTFGSNIGSNRMSRVVKPIPYPSTPKSTNLNPERHNHRLSQQNRPESVEQRIEEKHHQAESGDSEAA